MIGSILVSCVSTMPNSIHGTVDDPKREHPVLDIRHWENALPPKLRPYGFSPGDVDKPGGVVLMEWARREAKKKGDIGPSVPADIFVWSTTHDNKRPWLTRIGGTPWRPKDKPWPTGNDGRPLVFLGQICFADSRDLFSFKLPGQVALIYGAFDDGYSWLNDGSALEWSPLKIKDPMRYADPPWGCHLPVEYQGVIHRTVQYMDWRSYDEHFKACGWKSGGYHIGSVQATSIGKFCSLPQGWPFEEGDGNELVCTLSSFGWYGEDGWPCVDIPMSPRAVNHKGEDTSSSNLAKTLGFLVGDGGTIWVYRDKNGDFHLDEACG